MAKKREKGKPLKNPRQELFCKEYALGERFGSGVYSYASAYGLDLDDPKDYKHAGIGAVRLLKMDKVTNRINELLEESGLNDQFVDKQLLHLISQHDDKSSKIAAIREYNKMQGRSTNKVDVTTDGKALPVNVQIDIIAPTEENEDAEEER